jgi:formylglycine-generating enzyme required for sulfatase activity
VAAELSQIESDARPKSLSGQSWMDAVLFHPQTSERRALILALGTYGTQGLEADLRHSLTPELVALYRDDPDSGIHSASAWTLRQWGRQDLLRGADDELMKLKDRGERRWLLNSQGQTFAVIQGPVEFRMGSPQTEPNRGFGEIPHRRTIPRRFAVAATEVTVQQFRQFRPGHPHDARAGPDDDGPINNVSLFNAAEYCNWLSRQEALAECYGPNADGSYAEGMILKPGALHLSGYRLPTEAEWEYACRAGAQTSRPYGASPNLLDRYAWYQANARERSWPVGSLQPNDLGLFDTLGNVLEWCQEQAYAYQPDRAGSTLGDLPTLSVFESSKPFIVRGGAYLWPPAGVRTAYRGLTSPSVVQNGQGFRLARTLP